MLFASITDLLIDIVIRFIKYIKEKQKPTPTEQRVHIWNMLLILISSAQHISSIIPFNLTVSYTFQTVLFIGLSCMITFNLGKSVNFPSSSDLETGKDKVSKTTSDDLSESSIS